MTVSNLTGILLDAPLPQASPYSLLNSVNVVSMGADEHYLMGVRLRGWPNGVPNFWEWRSHSGNKAATAIQVASDFTGFSVYWSETCNLRGVTPSEFTDRLERIFDTIASYAVEQALWTGIITDGGSAAQPGLATEIPVVGGTDATMFPAASTAKTMVEGIALLEAAIATGYGKQGVIHLTPSLATWLAAKGQNSLFDKGGKLQTVVGTRVVVGAGYQALAGVAELPSGSSSTPVPPVAHSAPTGTQEWAFATGPIDIRRTPIDTIPDADEVWMALDRVNDTITYEAEQHYLLAFDGAFKAAVKIDRTT